VLAVFHVTGAADLQLHVAVRDVGHLRDLICDRLATRKEVDRCESSIIYSYTRTRQLPRYITAPAEPRRVARPRRRARGAPPLRR
jgi:DNA-binding Lrp family transcriptional regulator